MVQTEDQYVFIHEALLEAVMAGYTEIPCRSLHHHIQQLMQTEPGKKNFKCFLGSFWGEFFGVFWRFFWGYTKISCEAIDANRTWFRES